MDKNPLIEEEPNAPWRRPHRRHLPRVNSSRRVLARFFSGLTVILGLAYLLWMARLVWGHGALLDWFFLAAEALKLSLKSI